MSVDISYIYNFVKNTCFYYLSNLRFWVFRAAANLNPVGLCLSWKITLHALLLLSKALFIYYTDTTTAITSAKYAFPIFLSCIHIFTQTLMQIYSEEATCAYTHTHASTNTVHNKKCVHSDRAVRQKQEE